MRYEVNAVIQAYAVYLIECATMQINLVLRCCCCCCRCWVARSLVRSDAWSLGSSVGRSGGRSVGGGGGGGSGSGGYVRSLAAFATLREQLWAPRHDIWRHFAFAIATFLRSFFTTCSQFRARFVNAHRSMFRLQRPTCRRRTHNRGVW